MKLDWVKTAGVSQLSWWLACVVAPVFFVAVSLAVTLLPNSKALYNAPGPQPLDVIYLWDERSEWSVEEALTRASRGDLSRRTESSRREAPLWILIDLSDVRADGRWIDFPSRHAVRARCWDGNSLMSLGQASLSQQEGAVFRARTGFSLDLAAAGPTSSILCRLHHSGPARITVNALTYEGFAEASLTLEYKAGLTTGGILLLALFALILSALNRDWRLVLLAVWLVLGLRLAQLSLGIDDRWLGYSLPPEWMPMLRKLGITLFFLTTFQLHVSLMPEHAKVGLLHKASVYTTQFGGLLLIFLALLLPYGEFLLVMWVVVSIGVSVSLAGFPRIILGYESRQTLWVAGAVLVVILASAWEIFTAAVGIPTGFLNHQSALPLASCLVVVAFAAQMKDEIRERKAAQSTLKRTYDRAPVGLFTLNGDTGRLEQLNSALARLLGSPERELAKSRWGDHFENSDWDTLKATLLTDGRAELEVNGAGNAKGLTFHVTAVWADGHVEGSVEDITERYRAVALLRHLAEHDALTKALNRKTFEDRLAKEMQESAGKTPLALTVINLRRFRLINELYGLHVGDLVLQEAATRIRKHLLGGQVLGRLSSDCFAILTPGTGAEDIEIHVITLVDALRAEPLQIGERIVRFDPGAGVVDVTAEMAYSDVIALAEFASREADGDQRVQVYAHDSAEIGEWIAQHALMLQLERPDGFDGLYLMMQPILALKEPSRAHNFEVLLRMNDRRGRNVPVGQLLAAAQSAGLMTKLDLWVIRDILIWLDHHRKKLSNTKFICVNLSGASLNDPGFTEAVTHLLTQHPDSARLLCMEVTESVALRNFEQTRSFMRQLKSFGVRFALDDFGAGYSSYTYLMELPIEVLKIDGSLVKNIAEYPARQAIVTSIAGMAADLGLRCIAEWVEDAHSLDVLVEAGVDYVQGFGLAHPLPPDEILRVNCGTTLVHDPALHERMVTLDATVQNALH